MQRLKSAKTGRIGARRGGAVSWLAGMLALATSACGTKALDSSTFAADGMLSIFGDAIPPTQVVDDGGAVELGVKFVSATAGHIHGIRFYRGVEANRRYTAKLWRANGQLVAETSLARAAGRGAGWRVALFGSPVEIAAGATFVASYYAPDGHYADEYLGLSRAVVNGPLTALSSASAGGNGVYRYGSRNGSMPRNSWRDSNYFVDVLFQPAAAADSGPGMDPPREAGTHLPGEREAGLAADLGGTGGPGIDKTLPAPVLLTSSGGLYGEGARDLDRLNRHYVAPPGVVAPRDVFAPKLGGTPANGTPVIASFTRTAKADESVILRGSNFTSPGQGGKDTRVWIYRQTGANDGRLYQARIVRADATMVVAAIDRGEPYGVYMLWVENAAGAGHPVQINAPELWWLGPDFAAAGEVTSVYGRNLTHDNGEASSHVYLRPWGAGASSPAVEAALTAADPAKVTFKVPSGLAAGDYEVWLHSGHGGAFGWAGPERLHLDASPRYAWKGTTREATSHGANATDPNNDDASAIQSAINASRPGDIVRLAAGSYRIGRTISLSKGISLEGAGADKTTVWIDASFSSADAISLGAGSRLKGIKVLSRAPATGNVRSLVHARGYGTSPVPAGYFIEDCVVETPAYGNANVVNGYNALHIEWVKDVFLRRTQITAFSGAVFEDVNGVFASGNSFTGNWIVGNYNGPMGVYVISGARVDFSGNHAQSMDASGDMMDGDRTLNRWLVFSDRDGACNRNYVGHNTLRQVGNPRNNTGEQIMWETGGSTIVGAPAAVSAVTLSFGGVNWRGNALAETKPAASFDDWLSSDSSVYVVRGAGLGQYRRIVANTANTLTVDRPWDVPPDATSTLVVASATHSFAVYGNDIVGIPNYYQNESATAGIETYGTAFDGVIARNSISRAFSGIYLSALGWSAQRWASANMGLYVADNVISEVCWGIMAMASAEENSSAPVLGTIFLDNVLRGNRISKVRGQLRQNAGGVGIIVGGQLYRAWGGFRWPGEWASGNLVEANEIADTERASVYLYRQQYDSTVRRNRFLDNNLFASSYWGGNAGVLFDADSHAAALVENEFSSNLDARYAGTVPAGL